MEVFEDAGESANSSDRPEFQRLIQFCSTKKNRIEFVVVLNLARFSRNASGVDRSSGVAGWVDAPSQRRCHVAGVLRMSRQRCSASARMSSRRSVETRPTFDALCIFEPRKGQTR